MDPDRLLRGRLPDGGRTGIRLNMGAAIQNKDKQPKTVRKRKKLSGNKRMVQGCL